MTQAIKNMDQAITWYIEYKAQNGRDLTAQIIAISQSEAISIAKHAFGAIEILNISAI